MSPDEEGLVHARPNSSGDDLRQSWASDPAPEKEREVSSFAMSHVALAVCVSCAMITIVCGLILLFGPGSEVAANTMGFSAFVGLSAFLGFLWFLVNERE